MKDTRNTDVEREAIMNVKNSSAAVRALLFGGFVLFLGFAAHPSSGQNKATPSGGPANQGSVPPLKESQMIFLRASIYDPFIRWTILCPVLSFQLLLFSSFSSQVGAGAVEEVGVV